MKKNINLFLVVVVAIVCVFSLMACNTPDQIEETQENTSVPVKAWQDHYGNLHVEVNNSADTEVQVIWNGDEDNWCYYMEEDFTLTGLTELEQYVGEEISIYSRISERYNDDDSIRYLPSEKSSALKYTVKEAWDDESTEYCHFARISETKDGQYQDIINPPLSGTIISIDVSYWTLGVEEDGVANVVKSAVWYFSNIEKTRIFIKRASCDNKNYILENTDLEYEYKLSATDTQWTPYNKDTGINVGDRESIITRIAETSEKCCSADYTIFLR